MPAEVSLILKSWDFPSHLTPSVGYRCFLNGRMEWTGSPFGAQNGRSPTLALELWEGAGVSTASLHHSEDQSNYG